MRFNCGSFQIWKFFYSETFHNHPINSSQAKQQIQSQAKGRKGRKRCVEDQENKEDIRGDHVDEDNMKGASLSMTRQIDFLSILS
jgi:hypothetical protein